MNKFKEASEIKKDYHETYIDFMYRVYFSYNFVDNREELVEIIKDEIIHRPLIERDIYKIKFSNKNEAFDNLFDNLKAMTNGLLKGNYDSRNELLKFSSSFNYLKSK